MIFKNDHIIPTPYFKDRLVGKYSMHTTMLQDFRLRLNYLISLLNDHNVKFTVPKSD